MSGKRTGKRFWRRFSGPVKLWHAKSDLVKTVQRHYTRSNAARQQEAEHQPKFLWPQNSVGIGSEQWFLKQAAKGIGKGGHCDELEGFARNSVGTLFGGLHLGAPGLNVNLSKAFIQVGAAIEKNY